MNDSTPRRDGRHALQIRQISITPGVFEYAPGSVLLEAGKTKILCAVSLQQGVPPFLKGKKEGWLTCEYALLPMATQTRSQRESNLSQRNGRSIEISRFLGRVLRNIVDVSVFPDQTIIVDCDVLQADGSTRVACVTAASIALSLAQNQWLSNKLIDKTFITEPVYGVSVGIVKNAICVDIDFAEDSEAQADFNLVFTESGKLVEILGGSETSPISLTCFSDIQKAALEALESIKKQIAVCLAQKQHENTPSILSTSKEYSIKKVPLFGLQKRLFTQKI